MKRTRNPWLITLFALAGLVALLVAACGGDDDSSKKPATSAPGGASPAASASSSGGQQSLQAQLDAIKGDTTGVTDKEVKFGAHVPKTGLAAVYNDINVSFVAYFDEINKKGGIAGRQIKFLLEDDGYNPVNTVNVVKKLVEQDQIFAMFQGLGTPTHGAVVDYLIKAGVPDLFVASGDSRWANSGPTVIGMVPDYLPEGTVLGKYAAQNYKGKKFGILYQNDDFGKLGRDGLKKGIGNDLTLVGEEAFEATALDLNAQATKLINAGAEVIGVYATPAPFAATLKAVKAQGKSVVWISSSVASTSQTATLAEGAMDGVITGGYAKDVSDPDPNIQKAVKFMQDHGIAKPNVNSLYGYFAAEHLERLLTVTGKNLNRQSIIFALENMAFQGDWKATVLLRPSIVTKTDHRPIEYLFLQKWSEAEKKQVQIGDVIDAETTKK
jgi:ABC-type branched-subunit amino acid transport system substrate-binding protein